MPTRTVITMCPMNCHPTFCGMRVTTDGQQVVRVDGDPDNPDSHGFLCVRGRAADQIRDNPQRLLTPLRRRGPRGADAWQPISWTEALDTIVGAIEQTRRDRAAFWFGHGALTTSVSRPLLMRFGHLAGMQVWTPAMVCWALGAYGLALTGALETNTKEDMAAHSETILLWGANIASQPTTAPHLVAARRRGARVVLIDCRVTETARHADDVYLIRPGTDAALALALANVIIAEGLADDASIETSTIGFAPFAAHVRQFTPEWAAPITGIEAGRIRELARLYASHAPSMIVLGGSSIFKHQHGWQAGRAIACLPALTGQFGRPGGGFGPRHRGLTRGAGFAALEADDRRPPGAYIPPHMPSITAALERGDVDVLLMLGTNMLSSFADAGALERGLSRTGLVVGMDVFMNESMRRAADIILPGTVWAEELGIKDTATHIYLMEQALEPLGEARTIIDVLCELAERLTVTDFFPWLSVEAYIDAWLAPQHDDDGPLTVARQRERGGRWERTGLSHVAYPDLRFHTPSGKIEFWSERAAEAGLAPLPVYDDSDFTRDDRDLPLQLAQGRTLTHFHSFYDEGRALPKLAALHPAPEAWVNPADARTRAIHDGSQIVLRNAGGSMTAIARVTADVPPGVVWMRDGWFGLNHLTSGAPSLPAEASELLGGTRMPGGQSAYHARIDIDPANASATFDDMRSSHSMNRK